MTYDPKSYWDKRAFAYLRFEPFRVARELLLSPLRIRLIDQEIRRLAPKSLMEVGCGPGRMLPLYAGLPEVHCVDFSKSMLRRARSRAKKPAGIICAFHKWRPRTWTFPTGTATWC